MKAMSSILLLFVLINLANAQWSEQNSGVSTDLYCVSAVNNNVAWIGGAAGKVLLTTNGGTNWIVTTVPIDTLELGTIWGVNGSIALVTGTAGSTLVFKTTNGGANWVQVFSQPGGYINSIWMNSENNGFMMGDPVNNRWSLWKTTNGGSSWDSTGLYLPDTAGVFSFNNALFSTGSHIWFGTNGRKIYHSSNGGANWTAQASAGLAVTAVIWFNLPATGMAGGSSVLFTNSGGNNWASLPGTTSLHGMTGYGTKWWYVRIIGRIYYSSNNGSNWSNVYNAPSGLYFHMAKARDNTSIWAVRSEGGISKYTASTSEQIEFVIYNLDVLKNDVDALVFQGKLKAAFGRVLNNFLDNAITQINHGHYNAAINQLQLFTHEVNGFIDLGFLTQQLGQPLISNAAHIISLLLDLPGSDDNSHKQNIEYSFALKQNFPNPFNPMTNISFSVPVTGPVSLVVYDITGREVITLVNNIMNAGNYSVEFDASSLASGVYFYKLIADGFTDIKKMILLK